MRKKVELNEIIIFIDDIIQNGMNEIHRDDNNPNYFEYRFKVNQNWYKISIEKLIGTVFRDGDSLILRQSIDNISWDEIMFHQTNQTNERNKFNEYLKKIDLLYSQSLLKDNEIIKKLSTASCEILCNIDYIEKLNDYLFLIKKNEILYSVILNNDFNSLASRQIMYLNIKNGEQIVFTSKDREFNLSIMKFLDILYFSTKINNLNKITTLIKEYIK